MLSLTRDSTKLLLKYNCVFHTCRFHSIVFGGMGRRNKVVDNIYRLDGKSFEWADYGKLTTARSTHNAIWVDDYYMVFGGEMGKKTEKCSVEKQRPGAGTLLLID